MTIEATVHSLLKEHGIPCTPEITQPFIQCLQKRLAHVTDQDEICAEITMRVGPAMALAMHTSESETSPTTPCMYLAALLMQDTAALNEFEGILSERANEILANIHESLEHNCQSFILDPSCHDDDIFLVHIAKWVAFLEYIEDNLETLIAEGNIQTCADIVDELSRLDISVIENYVARESVEDVEKCIERGGIRHPANTLHQHPLIARYTGLLDDVSAALFKAKVPSLYRGYDALQNEV